MPNALAYLVLFAWPLVAGMLFRLLPREKALIWTLLGGYLVLPSATSVKLPMIPVFDKHTIPAVTALVLCHIHFAKASADEVPKTEGGLRFLVWTLITVLLFVSPMLTVATNAEPIVIGPTWLPGLSLFDALSMMMSGLVAILPFFLALWYLNTPEAHREILRAIVQAALAYSVLAMVEVRLSPQLHVWIYGFFPHDFIQHIRAGGFRPVVFLNHGLMVGILFCMSILASLSLMRHARATGGSSLPWVIAAAWLTVTLVLAKSVGALVIAVVLGLMIVLSSQRLMLLVLTAVVALALFYPTLRGAGLVPVGTIHELVLSQSEDRAQSLKFRLDNEDDLLAHANRKPFAGWGGWGRNQVYDPVTGRMVSVTDGLWIILIGIYGWIGYVAHFGLFTLPILVFAWRTRELEISWTTLGLLILLGANLIDFLPNAGLVPYIWMFIGALTGRMLQSGAARAIGPIGVPVRADKLLRTVLG